MLPPSAAEARRLGCTQYFTGKPCKHGHIAPRQTINATCMACSNANYERWKAADPEHSKATQDRARQTWMDRNPGWEREQYRKHRSKKLAVSQRWAERNRGRSREIKRHWKRKNPEWVRNWARKRAQRIGRAAPAWLTAEQHEQMAAIYIEARRRGPEWHVDHIVPLHGKTVCGLHVPWNLQILSAEENTAKGNRLLEAA